MEDAVSKGVCEERHEALKQYLSNDKQKIQQHDLEIRDFKEAMVVLTALQARHDNDIRDHEGRLRGIESKPGKRWDSVTAQVIQLIVAAVAGGLISRAVMF